MASPVDTSVKFLNARAPGAPDFGSAAGSLITLLDAFLVNGYGLKSVDTAVIADGVCTLNFSSGVGPYEVNTVILIEGATPTGLNGEQKLTAVTPSSVSFATDLPDGAVTGTITFKCAPCGWEKVFSKTNVAVYRNTDPASSRPYLRIDASNAAYARVTQYEVMTSVDVGTGMIPLAGVVSGGYYWHHGSHAAKDYFLAGDSRTLYICFLANSAQNLSTGEGFSNTFYCAGDFKSLRSGDFYSSILTGNTVNTINNRGCVFEGAISGTSLNYASVQRSVSGFGGGMVVGRWAGHVVNDAKAGGAQGPFGPVAGSVDNTARFTDIHIGVSGAVFASGVRGVLRGTLASLNTNIVQTFGFYKMQHVGRGALLGKTYYAIPIGVNTNTSASDAEASLGFVDITGPWQ